MNIDFISLVKNPYDISKIQTEQLNFFLKKYPYCHTAQILYLKGLQNQESFLYYSHLKRTAAYSPQRDILFNYITTPGKTKRKGSKKNKPHNKKTFLFKQDQLHSFSQWLQLTNLKKIDRSENNTKKPQTELIKPFLSKKRSKPHTLREKSDSINIAEISIQKNNSLATETLAKIYFQKKLWKEAIKAYEILSLKYPKKNSFFVSQIKKIRKIQKLK